jgi:hypothetical protein
MPVQRSQKCRDVSAIHLLTPTTSDKHSLPDVFVFIGDSFNVHVRWRDAVNFIECYD